MASSDQELNLEGRLKTGVLRVAPDNQQLCTDCVPGIKISYVKAYLTRNGKRIHILLDGFPVNYLRAIQHPRIYETHATKHASALRLKTGLPFNRAQELRSWPSPRITGIRSSRTLNNNEEEVIRQISREHLPHGKRNLLDFTNILRRECGIPCSPLTEKELDRKNIPSVLAYI